MPKRIFKSSQIVGSCASERGKKRKSPVRESEEERGKKSAGRQRGWTEDVQCAVEDRLRWEGPCSFGIKSRLIKLINAR